MVREAAAGSDGHIRFLDATNAKELKKFLPVTLSKPATNTSMASSGRTNAAETFNETLAVMISIFTMAEGLGLRMKNPAIGVEPLPIEKPKPEPPKPKLKLPKRVRLRLK